LRRCQSVNLLSVKRAICVDNMRKASYKGYINEGGTQMYAYEDDQAELAAKIAHHMALAIYPDLDIRGGHRCGNAYEYLHSVAFAIRCRTHEPSGAEKWFLSGSQAFVKQQAGIALRAFLKDALKQSAYLNPRETREPGGLLRAGR